MLLSTLIMEGNVYHSLTGFFFRKLFEALSSNMTGYSFRTEQAIV